MPDKNETRAIYKEIRKDIENRKAKEAVIFDRLFEHFGSAHSVFCYESFGSEVSTKDIIDEFLKRGAEVCVPVVSGGHMLLRNLSTGAIADKSCDLTLVPLLAFDCGCNRLGFGKGYYDRYLRTHDTVSVGIAFGEQYCKNLPTNELDMPLSFIITSDMILERGEKCE